MSSGLQMSRRIRRTPYTRKVEQAGVRGYTVVNHMLLPKAFGPSVEEDYWHLREHVQMWDVSTQRQVEIKGSDAARLVQWMTPRDLRRARIGQCLYTPLVDETGGLVNDPILLKLADDKFWLSIADSDVLLWAKGLAAGAGMDVEICEPDVSPLAVQGPRAEDVVAALFGDTAHTIGFFRFKVLEFNGTQQVVARSGYSRPGGFEIYLAGAHLGEGLWDAVAEAGKAHDIRAGCPNLIDRIEAGLFSYGNEFTLTNNPLECGLADFCSLDPEVASLSGNALRRIAKAGVARQMRGILFGGAKYPGAVAAPWPVYAGDLRVGQVTSGIWSPRLERHVGLSLIERGYWDPGTPVIVLDAEGQYRPGEIVELPFA